MCVNKQTRSARDAKDRQELCHRLTVSSFQKQVSFHLRIMQVAMMSRITLSLKRSAHAPFGTTMDTHGNVVTSFPTKPRTRSSMRFRRPDPLSTIHSETVSGIQTPKCENIAGPIEHLTAQLHGGLELQRLDCVADSQSRHSGGDFSFA